MTSVNLFFFLFPPNSAISLDLVIFQPPEKKKETKKKFSGVHFVFLEGGQVFHNLKDGKQKKNKLEWPYCTLSFFIGCNEIDHGNYSSLAGGINETHLSIGSVHDSMAHIPGAEGNPRYFRFRPCTTGKNKTLSLKEIAQHDVIFEPTCGSCTWAHMHHFCLSGPPGAFVHHRVRKQGTCLSGCICQ